MSAEQIAEPVQQLARGQEQLQHALAQQAATLDASLKQQALAVSRMDEGNKFLNNPKLIGKLNSFSGKGLDWPNWSFLFETWVSSIYG